MTMHTGESDSLRITVLVEDSVSFYAGNLMAVHGLSCLIETFKNGNTFRMLMDVGSDPEVLFHNMEILGVSPACVDAIMLTHCHWDHTRGLSEVLKKIGKRNLPVVAHPAIYRSVFAATPRLRYTGIDPRDFPGSVEENGGVLFLSKDPVTLAEGLVTTGEIERLTGFEGSGVGVRVEKGTIVEDNMPDDVSLVANVKDRGLVVMAGCSHAGIVNIVRQASRITGVTRVCAVIGGFHLINADPRKIENTVNGLLETGAEIISAGHCTGFEAQYALKKAFGERFTPMQCGSRYEFGSLQVKWRLTPQKLKDLNIAFGDSKALPCDDVTRNVDHGFNGDLQQTYRRMKLRGPFREVLSRSFCQSPKKLHVASDEAYLVSHLVPVYHVQRPPSASGHNPGRMPDRTVRSQRKRRRLALENRTRRRALSQQAVFSSRALCAVRSRRQR